MKNRFFAPLCLAALLSGCAELNPGDGPAIGPGTSASVEYGTVLVAREIGPQRQKLGVGTGGSRDTDRMVAGSAKPFSAPDSVWDMVAGEPSPAEMRMERKQIQYAILEKAGNTLTVIQDVSPGERVFAQGEKVAVKTTPCTQRVIALDAE